MWSWFYRGSHDVNPNQRILGSVENAIMKLSQQHQGYMKVVEVLHLQGPYISVETLTAAVERLQRRHPILRSRLRMHIVTPDSYLLDEDDILRLKIREIPRNCEEYLNF
ncbi:unnamed protein product [Rotaria magnacalcarata]|uniref:Uncharacterized protein n=1 Tax=Rotaria magnacalcarata TaxID=392030 RepID=A0A8S2VA91_9BILA|nr:unnamed protein product [Rotaria magnacalcarata]